MATLERAIQIATEAHAGQVDKGGKPYIEHPTRVAAAVDGTEAKIVAMLHDVVEDSDFTLTYLKVEGFSPAVLEAVDALTKRRGETYTDAILRVSANPLATEVKLADLTDNSDTSRLPSITEIDTVRLRKYADAAALLRTERMMRCGGRC